MGGSEADLNLYTVKQNKMEYTLFQILQITYTKGDNICIFDE